MRVASESRLLRRTTCSTCLDDEHASPGARCTCHEEELRLEVVGDVTYSGPGGEQVTIISVREFPSGLVWGARQITLMDEADAEELRWALSLKAAMTKGSGLVREAAEIAELLRTHVELAIQSGTDIEKVQRYLQAVRDLVLVPRNSVRAA
jgi:hypothetical protein